MTTAQVARVFHAKRIKQGKYLAKCPVHNDHRPSLWIMDGKKNCTVLGCWAGCDKRDILSAVGLTFSDLFADSKPDAKAMREAERLAAKEALERKKAKAVLHRTIERQNEEVKRRNALGKLLMNDWRNTRLNRSFHESIEKARSLDQSVVDQMRRIYHFKPDDFGCSEGGAQLKEPSFIGKWYLMLIQTFSVRKGGCLVMEYPEWWNECFAPNGDPATVIQTLTELEPLLPDDARQAIESYRWITT